MANLAEAAGLRSPGKARGRTRGCIGISGPRVRSAYPGYAGYGAPLKEGRVCVVPVSGCCRGVPVAAKGSWTPTYTDQDPPMTMDMKLNAERIRTLREQRAWSQEHLATVAWLSTRTLQRIEAGAAASQETCLALAAALDVGVEELTGDARKSANPPTATADALASRLPSWVMMGLLVVVLVVWFGYTIGKDAAFRDNRADAACEQDTAGCD